MVALSSRREFTPRRAGRLARGPHSPVTLSNFTAERFGVRPHYGWVIASVLFVCFTLTVGMLQYSFGVFVSPLEDEFGWSRAEVNISLSFFAMTGLLAPVAGPLLDRFGSSRVMMLSYLLLAVSFLPRPWMTELWEFYVLNIIMYAGMPGAIMLPVGKLIGIWFVEARGRAVGITAMGANFGGFIFSAQTRTLIDLTDWRATYFIFGLTILLLIPIIALTIRETPRRNAEPEKGTTAAATIHQEGLTAREAIRTRAFVLITIGLLLATIPYQSVLTQVIPHLEAEGMSPADAAWVLSVLAAFGMVGKVLLGWLTEKIAARKVFVGSVLFQAAGIVLLINAGTFAVDLGVRAGLRHFFWRHGIAHNAHPAGHFRNTGVRHDFRLAQLSHSSNGAHRPASGGVCVRSDRLVRHCVLCDIGSARRWLPRAVVREATTLAKGRV